MQDIVGPLDEHALDLEGAQPLGHLGAPRGQRLGGGRRERGPPAQERRQAQRAGAVGPRPGPGAPARTVDRGAATAG